LEGLGFEKDIAKLRLIQQTVNMGILWLLLIAGGKLYSAPIAGFSSLFIVFFILFFSKFKTLLKKIWKLLSQWKINYKKEIFPYQWKIALSWISGYFIFQLFNPVLFATDGAVVAGQMGMTLAVLNGIQNLSISWMTTKVPLYSRLIALKDYSQLDKIFNKTFKQLLLINAIGLMIMLLGIYILRSYNITVHSMNLGERFLDYIPMLLMMGALFLNQFIFSWATYLRCHKQEPMLWQSVTIGILCMLSTIIFGKLFGVKGITTGYFIITILSFIWAYKIFQKKKKKWHSN
jgi:O-antigen/teichoic acid export membrane protein